MTQEVLLWIGGIAAAIIGTLGLVLLRRVLDALDRVDKKVSDQGTTIARIDGSVSTLNTRVDRLDSWKDRVQERELRAMEDRALEAERRIGPPERRGAV